MSQITNTHKIHQRVFDSKSRGYWIWKTSIGYGDYPDFCKNLKELDMAFVNVGQKYGFVCAGDLARKREAEAL